MIQYTQLYQRLFMRKPFLLMLASIPLLATIDQAISTNIDSNKNTAISQEKIDVLSAQQREAFQSYREQLREIKTLKTYNDQLRNVISTQKEEMHDLNLQIVEIAVTQQRIMPLMQKMITSLNTFTKQDIPFLQKEREARGKKLQGLLAKANLTVSQKYRAIVEAYSIEMEFGRTVEAYEAPLGDKQSVDYLRIGRTALYYVTHDEKQLGIYNPNTQKFEPLEGRYLREIKKGLKIARKQLAPELLRLPVIATKDSK